jgi:tetratricopeptide (TPR) repeat protein
MLLAERKHSQEGATVTFDGKTPDLGPLPISDDKAALQRESIKALSAMLRGQDDIVFRDERIEDYGVDGSFELKSRRGMTNFRSQVQMKAAESLESNRDGSISLSVQTANLNYLLNGVAPVYILYDVSKGELWYVWAQEESRRLETENPSWRDQTWITLRFRNRLDKDALDIIYDRVLKTGRLNRQVHDSLARSTGRESVVIRIESESLNITDPAQARDALMASGTAIVAAGHPKKVIELLPLLDNSIKDSARIQLTVGYAYYSIGDHHTAIAHIRHALARASELGERDKTFLTSLKDASEFHVGTIDAATYQQRLAGRSQQLTGLEALQARQDALYQRCIAETDPDPKSALIQELRIATGAIMNDASAERGIKLDAKLLLLYVEGIQVNLEVTRKLFAAEMRTFLFPSDIKSILQNLNEAQSSHSGWEMQAEEALREAYDLQHPILIVEALTVSLTVRLGRLLDACLEAISRHEQYLVPNPLKSSISEALERAYQLCALNGSVESRLKLNKIEADFLEIQGDIAGAKAIAEKFYPEAHAMGFQMLAERAKEILEDRTLLIRYTQRREQLDQEDQDATTACLTDEELMRHARELLSIVGSPPAHPKKALGYVRSLRMIAQERCRWCRHIQIWEDRRGTSDPLTALSTTPTRKCFCDKFRYESTIASVDVAAVIADFKRDYCGTCQARDPKGA